VEAVGIPRVGRALLPHSQLLASAGIGG